MSLQRHAPRGGYDSHVKDDYRVGVWSAFRDGCVHPPGRAQALLMPSIEGTEIAVALAHGFREEHLHVVDRNPRIAEALHVAFPKIRIYPMPLIEAIREMCGCGVRLDVANFDLCGPVGQELLTTLRYTAASGVLTDGLLAITVLRGRDHSWALQNVRNLEHDDGAFRRRLSKRGFRLPMYGAVDCYRLVSAQLALSTFCIAPELQPAGGIYTSAPQSLLWMMYRLTLVEPTPQGAFAALHSQMQPSFVLPHLTLPSPQGVSRGTIPQPFWDAAGDQ